MKSESLGPPVLSNVSTVTLRGLVAAAEAVVPFGMSPPVAPGFATVTSLSLAAASMVMFACRAIDAPLTAA